MTGVSLFVIIYKYIHYALLKQAISKKRYEIAIFYEVLLSICRFNEELGIISIYLNYYIAH